VQTTSGLNDFSGWLGHDLFVGRSGQIVTQSGQWNSGGLLSGDVHQQVAVATNSGGFLANVAAPYLSGGPQLTPDSVTSGVAGSGSVLGREAGGNFTIASGSINHLDVGAYAIRSGNLMSGAVNLGTIASGLVSGLMLSGSIGSGVIGAVHLANASVLSGEIGSGSVGRYHLASGAVNSGHLGSGSVAGSYGSGAWNVASGTIGRFELGSLLIRSGHVASGAIQGSLGSGEWNLASGTIGRFELGNAAVHSGNVGSGQIDNEHLANASVVSGSVGSGVLGEVHHSSGTSLNSFLMPTVERISGSRAVCVTSGNVLAIAQAGSGLRLPAVGVVVGNYESGDVAECRLEGAVRPHSSGIAEISGMAGKLSYVGSGGIIVTASGLQSGAGYQRLGVIFSGGLFLRPDGVVTSGALSSPPGAF
jgi:hypothetical protein